MLALTVILRDATDADADFLRRLYASTRTDLLAQTGWDEAMLQSLIDLQFEAQRRGYAAQHPHARCRIAEHDAERIGRLWTDRSAKPWWLLDIALLPEWRAAGWGTVMLQGLLDDARQAGVAVRLHVEPGNPARRLYRRLGFAGRGAAGPHEEMEWRAIAAPAATRLGSMEAIDEQA